MFKSVSFVVKLRGDKQTEYMMLSELKTQYVITYHVSCVLLCVISC